MVLVPAVLTLIVSIVRLVGELQGWNDMLFGNQAPGPDSKPALIAIIWLAPIFGCWFGWKLRKSTGGPAKLGKASLLFVIGSAMLVGGIYALVASGLVVMPTEKAPGTPTGMEYFLGLMGISALVMIAAWPRLAATLLVYGILARIPVLVITYLALEKGWTTHHTKLPPGMLLPEGTSKFEFLAMPQVTFWIVGTLMLGGLFGCLGALLAGNRSK